MPATPASLADRLRALPRPRLPLTVPGDGGGPITLTFQALGRADLAALREKHSPTAAQDEDDEFNPDTFGPALVAASLDGLTEDDARLLLDTWGDGEATALLTAAYRVQSLSRIVTAPQTPGE